jgi:hypothetical protein
MSGPDIYQLEIKNLTSEQEESGVVREREREQMEDYRTLRELMDAVGADRYWVFDVGSLACGECRERKRVSGFFDCRV